MSKKVKSTLGEITLSIFDGKHGDCKDHPHSGCYFISVKDLQEYGIDYSQAREIDPVDFQQNYTRTNLENGDTLYANTGDTIGKSLYIKNNPFAKRTSFQKSVAVLKPNTEHVEPRYLYYLLKYETPRLRKAATGSGQKNLLLSTMRNFEVSIHDRFTQRKIVETLSCIDDRIQCNYEVNDNLQQQLRLMYDYWFNQFDFPNEEGKPYRTSGGAMEWCPELQRKIPAGWSCVSLEDIIQKNSETFDFSSIEPTVDLSIMPSGSIALDRVNRSDKFSTNLFRMNEGDILFGSIRPYLKKAGIAPCNGVVAGTIHSFRVKKETDYNFALFTLCGKAFFDYAVRVSTGTKMPIVSLDSIMSYKLPYSESIVRRFNHIDVRHTICSNVQEMQKLAALRDWLLPMLMNGQATISD